LNACAGRALARPVYRRRGGFWHCGKFEKVMGGVDDMDSAFDGKKEAFTNPSEALIAILDAARKSLSNGSGRAGKNEQPAERIYNVREAGELLRYKTSYIYELVKRGELAAIRHGKYITIRESAIREFIARNERRGE
jgi:excisionase family DNA binding protein